MDQVLIGCFFDVSHIESIPNKDKDESKSSSVLAIVQRGRLSIVRSVKQK